jgi:hypothetical protein
MATQIFFLGSEEGGLVSIRVDQPLSTVAASQAGDRLVQLTQGDEPVWVNFSNVLYLQQAGPL